MIDHVKYSSLTLLYRANSLTKHMGVLSLPPRDILLSTLGSVPVASICSVLLLQSSDGVADTGIVSELSAESVGGISKISSLAITILSPLLFLQLPTIRSVVGRACSAGPPAPEPPPSAAPPTTTAACPLLLALRYVFCKIALGAKLLLLLLLLLMLLPLLLTLLLLLLLYLEGLALLR